MGKRGIQPDSTHRHAIHEHILDSFEPTKRLFAPTTGMVDPRLFRPGGEQLHSEVRDEIMGAADKFFDKHGYQNSRRWARVYLAGSSVSEWWARYDFDHATQGTAPSAHTGSFGPGSDGGRDLHRMAWIERQDGVWPSQSRWGQDVGLQSDLLSSVSDSSHQNSRVGSSVQEHIVRQYGPFRARNTSRKLAEREYLRSAELTEGDMSSRTSSFGRQPLYRSGNDWSKVSSLSSDFDEGVPRQGDQRGQGGYRSQDTLQRGSSLVGGEPVPGSDWRQSLSDVPQGGEQTLFPEASYGLNDDLDVLIGIDYSEFKKSNPQYSEETPDEIDQRFNIQLRETFQNDEVYFAVPSAGVPEWEWASEPGPRGHVLVGPWGATGYVNANSWNIADIKPYAAYNVTDDVWAVKPIHEPNGHEFTTTEWYYFESIAAAIKAALNLQEPLRTRRLMQIWDWVHGDRSRAFGPNGTGAFDRSNALEKYLSQYPSDKYPGYSLMELLRIVKYQIVGDKPDLSVAASQNSNLDTRWNKEYGYGHEQDGQADVRGQRRVQAADAGNGSGDPSSGQGRQQADSSRGSNEDDRLRLVTWHPSALKEFNKLDKPLKKTTQETIEGLNRGEQNPSTHTLKGNLSHYQSTYLRGTGMRIVHRNNDQGGIHVGYIGHHDYKRISDRLAVKTYARLVLAEKVSVAGLAVKANDTGRVLTLQRSFRDESDPARGKLEFPGGHLESGETPWQGAVREWQEEVGMTLPQGTPITSWQNGIYMGFVYVIKHEDDLDINVAHPDREHKNPDDARGLDAEVVLWMDPDDLKKSPSVRQEVKDGTDWSALKSAELDD